MILKHTILILFLLVINFSRCTPPKQAIELTFVDTNSGANFQWFFKTKVIPAAEKKLDLKINYVVSSGPEIIQRMKTWKEGRGDIHILLIKPKDIVDMLSSHVLLETLYPDRTDLVPNITKCPEKYLLTTIGFPIHGKAGLFWRSQMSGIYNSAHVTNPPTSWRELYKRRKEWTGHIGMIRPDAKSSGGRRFIYCFFKAFGVNFSQPFEKIKKTPQWHNAWDKFKKLYQTMHKPLASEPPILFNQFKKEEIWLSVYSIDYTLWSRDKGLLPPTTKAFLLEDVSAAGADAYLVVPSFISNDFKLAAYKLLNFLLSDSTQLQMITAMWQYPGTDIWHKIPKSVWEHIPKWEDIEKSRLKVTNQEAFKYIREHTMEIIH